LRDIHANLGTQGFWRLRLGIGHPRDRDLVAGYVLSSPPAAEREAIEAQLERALDVVPLLLAGDFTRAMQELHPAERKAKAPRPATAARASDDVPGRAE
jgi:PTH1 family peptidyl-tRNA hydrolase